jgi:hypothetical protein
VTGRANVTGGTVSRVRNDSSCGTVVSRPAFLSENIVKPVVIKTDYITIVASRTWFTLSTNSSSNNLISVSSYGTRLRSLSTGRAEISLGAKATNV